MGGWGVYPVCESSLSVSFHARVDFDQRPRGEGLEFRVVSFHARFAFHQRPRASPPLHARTLRCTRAHTRAHTRTRTRRPWEHGLRCEIFCGFWPGVVAAVALGLGALPAHVGHR